VTTALDPLDAHPELFLPEPEPRPVRYTIISVDDHLVEPPHMFEGRLPAGLQDRAPRVVEDDHGHEVWEFEGERHFQVGQNAVAGRRLETVKIEPFRFDEMRRGCWDIEARIHDMDINGVWASLNFPSMITGFCGRVYSQAKDPELGLAVTRAWNDWFFDEWYSAHPDRIVPMGITWLADPEIGAAETLFAGNAGDDPFANLNTPAELAAAEAALAQTQNARAIKRPPGAAPARKSGDRQ